MSNFSGEFVSADSHVVEPPDLWLTRMDKRFRDRAPRVDSQPEGDYYVIDGLDPTPLGLEGAMVEEKIAGQVENMMGHRHADTRPGAWDVKARLADQDLDNVRSEVVYPGLFGLQFFAAPDAEYQRECIRVYNDWLGELCAEAPQRLLGAALVPMKGPIEWSIEEAQRVAQRGLRSISIACETGDRPFFLPEWEPLWNALEELGLPVSVHVGTSTGEAVFAKFQRLGFGSGLVDTKMASPIRAVADLIWSGTGVAENHPGLNFVLVESGIGWIASLLGFMDHWWQDHKSWMEPKLSAPPSEIFHRQFYATFEDDRAGLLTREMLNVDHLLWGSDYPHTEGTFPNSREAVGQVFAGVPEDEIEKMVATNTAQLYGVD